MNYEEWKQKNVTNNVNSGIIKEDDIFKKLNGKTLEDIQKEDIQKIVKGFEHDYMDNSKIIKLNGNDKRLEIQRQLKEYIFDKTGLNNLYPNVVDKEIFDKNINPTLYRGIKADTNAELDQYMNDFLNGKMYNKYSAYGSGSYFTVSDRLAHETYANNNNSTVIHAKIKDNAKVLKIDKGTWYSKEVEKVYNRLKDEKDNPNDINAKNILIQDLGLLSSLNGYSAIDMTNTNMQRIMLVLDRSKLEVLL